MFRHTKQKAGNLLCNTERNISSVIHELEEVTSGRIPTLFRVYINIMTLPLPLKSWKVTLSPTSPDRYVTVKGSLNTTYTTRVLQDYRLKHVGVYP